MTNRQRDRHTHPHTNSTTVTLAVHACRGLIILVGKKLGSTATRVVYNKYKENKYHSDADMLKLQKRENN